MRARNSIIFLSSVMLSGLSGCHSTQQATVEQPALENILAEQTEKSTHSSRDYSVFSPSRHNKALADYAEQIVMQLQMSSQFEQPIAVTSYVEFDDNLNTTNSFGNQLAEAVLVEMASIGYPVMDVTTSKHVLVDARGSFVFNRDTNALMSGMCCVLSGNLIYEPRGVRVNTKLLALENKRVLASSSQLIPYFIADQFGQVSSR